jgi:hypothetical protein
MRTLAIRYWPRLAPRAVSILADLAVLLYCAPLFTIHTGPCGPNYPGTIAAPSGIQTQTALHNHNHATRASDGRDANNGGNDNNAKDGLMPRRSRVRTLKQGIEVFSCAKAR